MPGGLGAECDRCWTYGSLKYFTKDGSIDYLCDGCAKIWGVKRYYFGDERFEYKTQEEFLEESLKIYINKETTVELQDDRTFDIECPKCEKKHTMKSADQLWWMQPELTRTAIRCWDCWELLEIYLERMEDEEQKKRTAKT